MDYEWKIVSKKGQKGIGYAEVHSAIVKDHPVCAVISFFPQITGRTNQKQVNVCLFFEGEKADLTDGLWHWIYNDIVEIVKQKEGEYFDENSEKLEYMITQTLLVDRMSQFDLISNGDYAIS